jgi:methylthioribose-1-phosphate isomerase
LPVKTIEWTNDTLHIIDQTLLPETYQIIALDTLEDVWQAIKSLQVRGAPAIGVCAAYGVLVGMRAANPQSREEAVAAARNAIDHLATSRPTAVNLFWALDRMKKCVDALPDTASHAECGQHLERQANAIYEEDRQLCRDMGRHGAELIAEDTGVLTHCNAGGLATSDYGTALAVMYAAQEQGRNFNVYADETRPLLQGARLTAWELDQSGIDVTVICDNMAAHVMREGKIQLVLVGSDRIAANGDAANKIGTYGVALLAKAHDIPFYVVAPSTTFDMSVPDGTHIPIELRDPAEVTHGFGKQTVPSQVKVYNPAFDVTPAELIHGIVTEEGILRPPYTDAIARHIAPKIGTREAGLI